jgi:hypothetical protein
MNVQTTRGLRISLQNTDGTNTNEKLWAGACEYITQNGQTTIHTYLSGPEGIFALHVKNPNGSENIRYIHKDHLGSLNTISDENGNPLQELSFDACSVKLGFCERSKAKALVEQIPKEARSREGSPTAPLPVSFKKCLLRTGVFLKINQAQKL